MGCAYLRPTVCIHSQKRCTPSSVRRRSTDRARFGSRVQTDVWAGRSGAYLSGEATVNEQVGPADEACSRGAKKLERVHSLLHAALTPKRRPREQLMLFRGRQKLSLPHWSRDQPGRQGYDPVASLAPSPSESSAHPVQAVFGQYVASRWVDLAPDLGLKPSEKVDCERVIENRMQCGDIASEMRCH